jgi:hypothetical protein
MLPRLLVVGVLRVAGQRKDIPLECGGGIVAVFPPPDDVPENVLGTRVGGVQAGRTSLVPRLLLLVSVT